MKRPAVAGDRQAPRRVAAAKDALAYVFKTAHLQHGGKLSLIACCSPAVWRTARRCNRRRGETGRVSGILAVERRPRHQAYRRRGRRRRRARQARHVKTGDTLSSGKTAPPALARVAPSPPVLAMALAAHRSQGRCQTRPGAVAAERGRSFADHDPQPANPRHRAVGPGRDASAGGAGAAARALRRQRRNRRRRRSAIRRPSANRSPSAAGTRNSPAATASSATWCWRSGRCRAAAASRSRKRSSAARCRETISARWKRAWSTGCSAGRSAFP